MENFDRETCGRIAKAEIFAYDCAHKLLLEEHSAKKSLARNRHHALAKYNLVPKARKEQEWRRSWTRGKKMHNHGCGHNWESAEAGIRHQRMLSAERIARNDWKLEQIEREQARKMIDWCRDMAAYMEKSHERMMRWLMNETVTEDIFTSNGFQDRLREIRYYEAREKVYLDDAAFLAEEEVY